MNTTRQSGPDPDLAEQLLNAAFATPRTPRSNEYRAGVLAALRYRIHGDRIDNPYRLGTAQADAYFSGTDEGHRLWRQHLEADRQEDAA